MKTKKLWIWSLLFGIIATLIVYFGLLSNLSASSSSDTEAQKSEQEITEETEPVVAEPVKREMINPMAEVSEGKRAVSLRNIALAEGISGYIEPNSYVDVIAFETTLEDKAEKESEEAVKEYRTAELILQKVKVLATGKPSDAMETALQYETVTIEVTPEEGVMLSLAAKDKDGFYFMLRNAEDSDVVEEGIEETKEIINKEGGREIVKEGDKEK